MVIPSDVLSGNDGSFNSFKHVQLQHNQHNNVSAEGHRFYRNSNVKNEFPPSNDAAWAVDIIPKLQNIRHPDNSVSQSISVDDI